MKTKYIKEFFLFPDICIMCGIFLVSVSLLIPGLTTIGPWIAFAIGMAAYAAAEYFTHRFLFHLKTPKNPFLLKLLKRLHYDHHANPNDLHLLFLPLWYTLPNLAIAGTIAYFISARLVIANAFLAGVILFLLFYEWKHYIAHRPVTPVSPWGRWMKKVHLWHHYKNENYWYGVTNPVFDLALGTFEDQKNVELSQTARNLEQRDSKKLDL
ncbi:fatty acid hydroxylase [Paenibacillus dendritiformis]|uniref:sterol desaturase family protein n=1 Tax=Paenibacillus dendritiformis TaxID=130049 RepID=UPI001B16CE39|nr:sterol desaturase family protein [Paenibacillus dendritiformis]GIO75021.1 fatty acid hydroxylase [Paenibacillus dendritiformis]